MSKSEHFLFYFFFDQLFCFRGESVILSYLVLIYMHMAPFGLWITMTVSEALIDLYLSISLHLSHQAAIYTTEL